MSTLPITLIVLTKDEELNLEHCLRSAAGWVRQIIVVDSGSVDRTVQIAESYGAEVHEHPFKNQADQFNWAVDNLNIKSEWVLRLDADEAMSGELWQEIETVLSAVPPRVNGFLLRRRVYFMGRWIRHGGYYPTLLLRLFRAGTARSEERIMDEHIILSEGQAQELRNDFKDDNHKSLEWWIAKHNDYSSREARAMHEAEHGAASMASDMFGSQPERKRWLKDNFYLRLPIFIRPFLYFFYRYFLRAGFLDGKEGFVFHFLQGLWYRFLVDVKYAALTKPLKRQQ